MQEGDRNTVLTSLFPWRVHLSSHLSSKPPFLTLQFVKFSKIEETVPTYNRHYDFFVDKFSSMCYKNAGNSLKYETQGGE